MNFLKDNLTGFERLNGIPQRLRGEESICQCRSHKRPEFNPWVEKIPWRKEWQPTPVSLPGESHAQRSLEGCSPRGRKESDMIEQLSTIKRPKCVHLISYAHTHLLLVICSRFLHRKEAGEGALWGC